MEIKPIYLFYGEERFLLQMDVDYFRKYFAQEDTVAEVFDGRTESLQSILDSAAEFALFGGKRLLIVNNAPWFSKKKSKKKDGNTDEKEEEKKNSWEKEGELLTKYAAAPNTDSHIVFIAENADKRLKTVKAVAEIGTVREYKKKKEYEIPEFLRKYASRLKVSVSPRAFDLMLQLCGTELGVLCGELDKLALYVEEGKRIEEADVEKLVSRTAEGTSFMLSDAIGTRKKTKVEALLNSILANQKQGEQYMLFGYLANYFKLLLRIKALNGEGKHADAIAKATGVHPFRVKKGLEAVRNYSEAELAEAYALMLDCDYKVKSGQWNFQDGLYITIMKIVSK